MTPQQIYSWHEPLAVALMVLTALFAALETVRRRR
jgi:TRAP-type C4-dicarboxylate transport system permease small subunit